MDHLLYVTSLPVEKTNTVKRRSQFDQVILIHQQVMNCLMYQVILKETLQAQYALKKNSTPFEKKVHLAMLLDYQCTIFCLSQQDKYRNKQIRFFEALLNLYRSF